MNKQKPPMALSLWLLPCASVVNDWQRLIDSLAADHEGPPFIAHVTAATISLAQLEPEPLMSDVINWLEAVAGAFGPLTLAVSPPTTGKSFFQCVHCSLPTAPVAEIGQSFLALAGNSRVQSGSQRFRSQHLRTQTTPRAHISLLYGSMTTDQKTGIAESISWPGGPLTLSTLSLVSPGEGQTDFSNPLAWEMLSSAELTGKPTTA